MFSHRVQQAIGIPLLVLQIAGCHSWRVAETSPQSLIEKDHPDRIRVTRSDSSVVILSKPVMVADSVVGFTEGSKTQPPRTSPSRHPHNQAESRPKDSKRVAVPSEEIKRMEVLKPDAAETAGVVILSIGVVVGIAALVALQACESSGCGGLPSGAVMQVR